LVAAGEIVMARAKEKGVSIIPVDSEHSAIFQAIKGHDYDRGVYVNRLILTASGGPFWGRDPKTLSHVTPEEAARHPRWKMGKKISVDSATMINKALEIIEARWLFDIPEDRIDVLIHPQSIVHSMVEYIDGSIIAQLGTTDMRIPIAYALSFPERIKNPVPPLDLARLCEGGVGLTFFDPDSERFPALSLAYDALKAGGTMPAVMSAANESAVEMFLRGEIGFLDIVNVVSDVMLRYKSVPNPDLEEILKADLWAREETEKVVLER
jgi:1-deoxy-D-xylulose-5-phosphate reductoisomerase